MDLSTAKCRVWVCLALLGWLVSAQATATNPHELKSGDNEDCGRCHAAPPATITQSKPFTQPKMGDFKVDGVEMCSGCHDAEDSSHKVGMEMDFEPPGDLPLSDEQTITCLTCHYVHGALASDRPWASVSFMDHLTGNPRLHKSYVLRRNNSNGELCLVCHNTQGSATEKSQEEIKK